MTSLTCSIDGCEAVTKIRGWCKNHYQAWYRHGDPLANKTKVGRKVCVIDDCDRISGSRQGWCSTHWHRWKKHGDTETVLPFRSGSDSHLWKGSNVGYEAAHIRVYTARSKASAQMCVDCGGRAKEWSYTGTDPKQKIGPSGAGVVMAYSLSPEFYTPRCVPCHRRHDLCK